MTKHICIDFEGEGKKESGLPLPHLLGALVPRTGTTGRDFRISLLRPELEPLAREQRSELQVWRRVRLLV